MNTGKIVLAGIAGTTAMSVFSYLVSKKQNRNFKEPELLGKMVKRIIPMDKEQSQLTGWTMHYGAGITFAAVYNELLKRTHVEPTIPNGLLVGAISAIPAVAIWATVFALHPLPPKITATARNRYYGHLLAAHLVFGAFTFWAYAAERNTFNNRHNESHASFLR